ncbi:uncharacterized protein LOC141626286 [Silene latifolia]|uniref:uncharacterized protein LOC141626286 n=1 Tax=Silene latifolia TaxID=37657 RepID=UPI003D7774E8
MSAKIPDNNEMEEETIHKKRARRVSFAETTAVHFFNRDDESESTPDNASKEELNSSNGKLSRTESGEMMELLQSRSSSSSDDSDGDDDVETVIKSAFLRPMESPSSGSCFGSATDEDNFFGPVSAEFIRPGRLSDSAISDENHEVTMDSTAFSMNFRSLARSDSGGEFKTPTGVRVPFGERTPGATSTEASLGDLMVLTGNGNRISHSSLRVTKVNDSGNSDDMSLLGTHHYNYDYGQLPPELDVLLAEGNESVEAMSLIGDIEYSNSMCASNPKRSHDLSGCDNFDQTDSEDAGSVHKNDFLEISAEAISVDLNVEKRNGDISDATLGEKTQSHSKEVDDGPGSITPINEHIQATFLQTHDIPLEKDRNGRIDSNPGSISSLLSKRRQIFKDPYGFEIPLQNSPQDDKVFHVRGTQNRAWSTSVFAKSVSRLKRLETSFLSASKFEGNASKLRVHGLSPKYLERDKNVEYASKDISFTRFDAPVACLYVRFAESDGQFNRESDGDSYDLKNTGVVQSESCIEVEKNEESLSLHKSSPSPKTSARRLVVSSSTSSVETGSLNCKARDSDESEMETPAIKTLQSMRSDLSLLDITFNDSKDSINTVMLGDIACLPASGVVDKVSASPLYESLIMSNVDHHGHKEGDGLASTVENYSSLIVEKKKKSKLSSCDIDHQLSKPAKADLKDKVLKSHNVISSNNDVETGRTLTSSTMDVPVQRMQSIPGCTLISDARSDELPVQVFDNPIEKQVCSMMLNVTCDLRDKAEVNFSEGQCDAPHDKLISKYNEDAQLLLESSDICASDGPLSHKRKLFDEIHDHDDHDLLSHKPKLCKDQKNFEEDHKGSHCIESDLASRDWADVFTSFCGVTKQLLIPISDKFDVAMVAKLDDIMVYLDKLKSYELLHHEKLLESAHSTRVADTKLLLYKTVYQKAKLQLVRLKRDKLLDQASRMKSRVDESEKMISSCDLISRRGEIRQIGCLQLEGQCTDTDNRSLVSAELCSLRKEFEDSEGEIRKINKSFYSYFKDMKELTSTETAAYVKSSLKKMVACQSLLSEMQSFKVERLDAIHGQPNIMFDHDGFLLQRFTMKSTSTSCLLLTNRLNKEKISKMFINDMDAAAAFSFVLSGDMQLTYEGLGTIAEQTQKTVSRLHIILDVVEEVQLAMMELKPLTWSRFCQPLAGKLDLQLCFTDFRSGARVTLILDITCLNQGVYPSQILPYEVQGITARNQDIFECLVEDIRTSVQGVRSGFTRIINFCRFVSRMIEAGGIINVADTH